MRPGISFIFPHQRTNGGKKVPRPSLFARGEPASFSSPLPLQRGEATKKKGGGKNFPLFRRFPSDLRRRPLRRRRRWRPYSAVAAAAVV